MKRDEIIEITKQAGGFSPTPEFLEAFAKLVEERTAAKERADEREACLKICDAQASTNYWEGADVCAEAIRARAQADGGEA